jgi:hypothetical protein
MPKQQSGIPTPNVEPYAVAKAKQRDAGQNMTRGHSWLFDKAAEAGDFLMDLVNPIPEDPTDPLGWGMELAPVGKGIGAAVGMIPPKYIKGMTDWVRNKVSTTPGFTPDEQRIIHNQIDANPRVASHLSAIRPDSSLQQEYGAAGLYSPMLRSTNPVPEAYWEKLLSGQPGTAHMTGGMIDMQPGMRPEDFETILRHEFNHGAQDVMGKLPNLHEWANENVPYSARPQEIGSRISEARGKRLNQEVVMSGSNSIADWRSRHARGEVPKMFETFKPNKALEGELNFLDPMMQMHNQTDQIGYHEALVYMNEEMKKRGKQLTIEHVKMLDSILGQAKPRRQFKVEDVLQLPFSR